MIRGMIFDLDGTLVKTERLKAISYAKATVDLCPYTVTEKDVMEAFSEAVGLPRREAALTLIERFDLGERASRQAEALGVQEPWQALMQMRLAYYENLISDSAVLRENQWPHAVALLQQAKEWACRTGLATMSQAQQAKRVLEALELNQSFDFVATRDDVEYGKPAPDIYELVAKQLGLDPARSLVIEDSEAGVQAAQAAGMQVIAVTTPFTRARIHEGGLLSPERIVDEPATLIDRVREVLGDHDCEVPGRALSHSGM